MSTPMSPSVTITPLTKFNGSPAGSGDAPLFTQDMMRSGSDVYWSYDPKLCTVVLRRSSSYEAENKGTTAVKATPIHSPSSSSTIIHPNVGSPKPSSAVTNPTQCHAYNRTASHNPSPAVQGLGINGLTNANGRPFDGTGVVGLSVSRNNGAHRVNGSAHIKSQCSSSSSCDDSSESPDIGLITSVSRTMIDELASAFTSGPQPQPPSPHRAHHHRRPRSNTLYPFGLVPPGQSTPAALPVTHEEEEEEEKSEAAGYFASIRTLPVLGLGILSLMRNGGEVFDGTGIVGLRRSLVSDEDREDDAAFALAQQVSRVLVEEVARTFTSADASGMSPSMMSNTRFSQVSA